MKICSDEDLSYLKSFDSYDKFLKNVEFFGIHWPQGVITRTIAISCSRKKC